MIVGRMDRETVGLGSAVVDRTEGARVGRGILNSCVHSLANRNGLAFKEMARSRVSFTHLFQALASGFWEAVICRSKHHKSAVSQLPNSGNLHVTNTAFCQLDAGRTCTIGSLATL